MKKLVTLLMLASLGSSLVSADNGKSGNDISGSQKANSNGKYDSVGDNDWDDYPINQSLSTGDFRVDFVGHSGQFKIYGPNNSTWIKIKMNQLQETDANGKSVNNLPAFASTNFQFIGPYQTTLGGVNATALQFFTTLSVNKANVNFSLITYMIPKPTVIPYGNGTINCTANTFKFTVALSAWPFESTSDKLRFGISILSAKPAGLANGENMGYSQKQEGNNGKNGSQVPQQKLGFGSSSIQAPTLALVDGVSQNITVETSTNGQNTLDINFLFPHYNKTLVYDPTMNVGNDTTTASTSLSAGIIAAIVIGCAVFVGGAGFLIYRKRYQKKSILGESNHRTIQM